MTSVDEVASAEPAMVAAPGRNLVRGVIGPAAVAIALLSALVTFLILAGFTPIVPIHGVVVSLLLVNVAAVLILLGVIAHEIWQVAQARRHGQAGARLHVRIVGLFSVIAAVPVILVAVVASITLDRGLDRWFSQRTRAVIENSLIVAQAYVREHGEMMRGDISAMSVDLESGRESCRERDGKD